MPKCRSMRSPIAARLAIIFRSCTSLVCGVFRMRERAIWRYIGNHGVQCNISLLLFFYICFLSIKERPACNGFRWLVNGLSLLQIGCGLSRDGSLAAYKARRRKLSSSRKATNMWQMERHYRPLWDQLGQHHGADPHHILRPGPHRPLKRCPTQAPSEI